MSDVRQAVRCGQCKDFLDELASALASERWSCPACGSLTRIFDVEVQEPLRCEISFGLKQRRPGRKRPVFESIDRVETFYQTGECRRVERSFDRSDPDPQKRMYRERIVDVATGEIIKDVKEPLPDHQGFGAAKRRKPPDTGRLSFAKTPSGAK